jgi:hypothetical protein
MGLLGISAQLGMGKYGDGRLLDRYRIRCAADRNDASPAGRPARPPDEMEEAM